VGVVLVVIAGSFAARAAVSTSKKSPPLSEDVTVIGDSLTSLAQAEFVSTGVDLGYRVTADGISGLTWGQRIDRVKQVAAAPPDVVVIELGTNDVLLNIPLARTMRTVDEAISALTNAPCVVFVNVGVIFGNVDERDAYDEALDKAVKGHSNMTVYDWKSLFDDHHHWSSDGVHLLPPYEHEFTEPILETARDHCSPSS
jgi:hypothetical protein